MRLKKKKGNTMLLLMVMILMITVMGATITTAIAYTDKQNYRVKIEEDLLYAAESGLEYAITKIKDGTKDPSGLAENQIMDVEFPSDIFNEYGIDVSVNIKNEISYFKVTSTAVKNGKSRVVTGKLMAGSSNTNIFKYVLCAEKINIDVAGDLDHSVSLWSVEDKPNSKVVYDTDKTTIDVTKDLKVNQMSVPTFNFPEHKKGEVAAPIEIINHFGIEYNLNKLDAESNGVKKITYTSVGRLPSKPPESGPPHIASDVFTIYLVNANELIIKEGVALNNTIIITNGKITIEPDMVYGRPAVTLNNSTLFGKEFNFKLGSFKSAFRLIDNNNPEYDKFTQTDVDNINNLLKEYGSGLSGGGESSSSIGGITDIEYSE